MVSKTYFAITILIALTAAVIAVILAIPQLTICNSNLMGRALRYTILSIQLLLALGAWSKVYKTFKLMSQQKKNVVEQQVFE